MFALLLLLLAGGIDAESVCTKPEAFHPVMLQPPGLTKLMDFTKLNKAQAAPIWNIGKYDEDRVIYTQALFAEGNRSIHMGIDLGGPVGCAVHAFSRGTITHAGINPADGDYGAVLVVEHEYSTNKPIYALYGHLAHATLQRSIVGQQVERGQVLGWIGDRHENGNWPPHLHFQLAWEKPPTHDMPGAVSRNDRQAALLLYPDPRLVLGDIY